MHSKQSSRRGERERERKTATILHSGTKRTIWSKNGNPKNSSHNASNECNLLQCKCSYYRCTIKYFIVRLVCSVCCEKMRISWISFSPFAFFFHPFRLHGMWKIGRVQQNSFVSMSFHCVLFQVRPTSVRGEYT